MNKPLSWIRRRARRLMRAFGVPLREAVREAGRDFVTMYFPGRRH